ncbi:NicO-domain-containing protein [Aureobasidium pullulans]|uniref:Nickel/cobalt efflux system n=2 Tax=Aureobasidium pullulans TaxID=5580 RepID=A0A074Y0S5_AURPU|nr:NicO-domain-containing protein [Aureobasidium pullulans EXF-150]THV88314.1 NicO-domain-containing protein [Aureobasidium pullulans]KEQ89509.1 NicO-domain-containing protein [Aureobasidium pullulans EXF-150]THV93480.1 NicO-domain-containing protein [Aureobasidium pullulans]THX88364.1 NicO-domain-containing protein [Aureobasidium pullulans]THY19369.1 NicO-domain-containing protein [Aureobasidium pullulans]
MSSQAEPLMVGENDATSKNAIYLRFRAKGKHYHAQIPVLKRLPFPSIAIISLLVIINILVWIAVGIVLSYHTSLVSTAVLAYSLGLRHALDADHISAIDLMTRRLIATGQRPVTVGTFFSLGHSTIVVITSIVVASTAAAVSSRFGAFSRVGGIIGSSVSATFLIVLGIMNVFILYKLITQLRKIINSPANSPEPEFQIEGGGCLFHVLKRMFKLIDRPWKMYPLGVLFGLGFDTSSEIALLGISAISASQGTSFWLILLFPVLFTAGMCLLDTTDGALMMALYTSTRLAKDNIAVLYYQSVLTGVTVLVAVVIGVIQFLGMLQGAADLTGGFWDGVEVASDNYDIIGGAICGSFVVFGVISAILYRPWRRRVDAKRNALVGPSDESDLETRDNNTEGIHGEPELVQEGPSTQHVHADRKGDCVV